MLSGHYVYTEVSNKRPGTVYDLMSEPYTYTGDMCVTFWYHMYGRSSGSLSLIRTDANQKNGVEVWKREGEGGLECSIAWLVEDDGVHTNCYLSVPVKLRDLMSAHGQALQNFQILVPSLSSD